MGDLSTQGNPFLYKAIRVDPETGLHYMRNRYYSSGLGRFLTVDPIGVWGDPINSGAGYGYAGARPVVVSDPLGKQAVVAIVVLNDTSVAGNEISEKYAQSMAAAQPGGGYLILFDEFGVSERYISSHLGGQHYLRMPVCCGSHSSQ